MKNSLTQQRPDIAQLWHPTKNTMSVSDITTYSSKKVWWLCPEGHEWEAVVYSITRPQSRVCPVCSGRRLLKGYNDIATVAPGIAAMWCPDNEFTAEELTAGSGRKLCFICSEGHHSKATVKDRTRYSCPYCTGRYPVEGETDLATTHPELSKEVATESRYKPHEVSAYSSKKMTWFCSQGHTWDATVANRTLALSGCPYCRIPSTSKTELRLAEVFEEMTTTEQGKMVTRWPNGRPLVVDIFLPKYNAVVEYDGVRYHSSEEQVDRDTRKSTILMEEGYTVVRLRENDLQHLTVDHPQITVKSPRKKSDYDDIVATVLSLLTTEHIQGTP